MIVTNNWADNEIKNLSKLMNVIKLGKTFGNNILYRCTNKDPKDKGVLYVLSAINFSKLEYINVYDGSKVTKYSQTNETHSNLESKHYVGGVCDSILSCFIFGFTEDKKFEFYRGNIEVTGKGEFVMDDIVGYFSADGKIKLQLPRLEGDIIGQIQSFPMKDMLKVNWKIE